MGLRVIVVVCEGESVGMLMRFEVPWVKEYVCVGGVWGCMWGLCVGVCMWRGC